MWTDAYWRISLEEKKWFEEDHWWWQANIIKHQNIITLFWSAPLHYSSSQSYALSGVKFLGLKLRLCKKNDKYELWYWSLAADRWSGVFQLLCQINGKLVKCHYLFTSWIFQIGRILNVDLTTVVFCPSNIEKLSDHCGDNRRDS